MLVIAPFKYFQALWGYL
uniref:Uncharacterized protein n=1 Tax=Anguilla anguilla TaxID=7936 RepID=A0A0E9UCZ6_ANGAN